LTDISGIVLLMLEVENHRSLKALLYTCIIILEIPNFSIVMRIC